MTATTTNLVEINNNIYLVEAFDAFVPENFRGHVEGTRVVARRRCSTCNSAGGSRCRRRHQIRVDLLEAGADDLTRVGDRRRDHLVHHVSSLTVVLLSHHPLRGLPSRDTGVIDDVDRHRALSLPSTGRERMLTMRRLHTSAATFLPPIGRSLWSSPPSIPFLSLP